ncbi:aminoglycoside N(3)-acetyltransferase [Streptomyces sp. NPDC001828]|uniref:aminoglycoside N(3)-acetyltransferase n=1 Tax=Streptomyces sp. NPDC001828 TaxID=3364615 RepID=UPI00367E5460
MLTPPLNQARLRDEFRAIGLREGATVIVHASLSAFGRIDGGAHAVVNALLDCLTPTGTLVVPTFTPEISDPHPRSFDPNDLKVAEAREQVPLFHEHTPTSMGAIPSAVLSRPERLRGAHPQTSVAAIGPHAHAITHHQPLAYALGDRSPFDTLHDLDADILLLGVGHNRNSFLHYAESHVPHHRRKLRRFPYRLDGRRLWLEAPDVGDDNGTHFPRIGEEFTAMGGVHMRTIGHASCQLMNSRALAQFATGRLTELLPAPATT